MVARAILAFCLLGACKPSDPPSLDAPVVHELGNPDFVVNPIEVVPIRVVPVTGDVDTSETSQLPPDDQVLRDLVPRVVCEQEALRGPIRKLNIIRKHFDKYEHDLAYAVVEADAGIGKIKYVLKYEQKDDFWKLEDIISRLMPGNYPVSDCP